MPRRPAKVTQADIARAIRAAKEAGASEVTVDGEGVIRIALMASATPIEPASNLDEILAHRRRCSATWNGPRAGETHLTQLMPSHRVVRLQALVHGENQCLIRKNAIPARPGIGECIFTSTFRVRLAALVREG
jgi:hypothetical protein